MVRAMTTAAIAAAVAGGNLGVTTAPRHPVVGKPVRIAATGQVGDSGGRLYLYRNIGRRCAPSVTGQRRLGRRARLARPPLDVKGNFEAHARYVPRRRGHEWICGYLYAITCDELHKSCGPAIGLPPDAGFTENALIVRS